MDHIAAAIAYRRNGVQILSSGPYFGVLVEEPALYQFPKGHPCHGCPYTLRASVPSCMFPIREGGGCFWRDLNKK